MPNAVINARGLALDGHRTRIAAEAVVAAYIDEITRPAPAPSAERRQRACARSPRAVARAAAPARGRRRALAAWRTPAAVDVRA